MSQVFNINHNAATESIFEVLSEVDIGDWEWWIGVFDGGEPYIQIQFFANDNRNDDLNYRAECRKWVIEDRSTTHIVRTAWKAYSAAMLHEMQETFKYKGKCIFDPHIDVDSLVNSN